MNTLKFGKKLNAYEMRQLRGGAFQVSCTYAVVTGSGSAQTGFVGEVSCQPGYTLVQCNASGVGLCNTLIISGYSSCEITCRKYYV
jgi:hypothetical protein